MKSDGRPTFRRRQYFIKRGLQGSFVLGISAVILAGLFINLFAAYFLIDRELSGELYKIHLRIRTTSEVAWPILWRLGVATVAVVAAVSLAIVWLLTKRVERPLGSFVMAVRKAAGGDLSERLSKREGIENLPEAFNAMAASIGSDVAFLKRSVGSIDGRLDSLKKGAAGEKVERGTASLELAGLSSEVSSAIGKLSRLRL